MTHLLWLAHAQPLTLVAFVYSGRCHVGRQLRDSVNSQKRPPSNNQLTLTDYHKVILIRSPGGKEAVIASILRNPAMLGPGQTRQQPGNACDGKILLRQVQTFTVVCEVSLTSSWWPPQSVGKRSSDAIGNVPAAPPVRSCRPYATSTRSALLQRSPMGAL